jgi:hypothetical protein
MTCAHCTQAAAQRHYGGYQFECVHCCARLVASARPVRKMQEAMLAAITRRPGRPSRQQILDAMKPAKTPAN